MKINSYDIDVTNFNSNDMDFIITNNLLVWPLINFVSSEEELIFVGDKEVFTAFGRYSATYGNVRIKYNNTIILY